MQLQPNENFPITYGIGNHLDTGTYYVQTKVYNSDNILIATVNLTDQGSNNFLKMWKVPYDNVYQRGKWIYMVTSIYTDSGYTTKSNKYADVYSGAMLIQERISLSNLASIGGGGIDYKELRKVVKEEIEKIEKPKKQKELDTKALVKKITSSIIDSLPPIPTPKDVDFSGLEKSINSLDRGMNLEFSEVLSHMRKLDSNIPSSVTKLTKPIMNELTKELNQLVKNAQDKTENFTNKSLDAIGDMIEDLKKNLPKILENVMDDKTLSLNLNLGAKEKDNTIDKLKAKYKI